MGKKEAKLNLCSSDKMGGTEAGMEFDEGWRGYNVINRYYTVSTSKHRIEFLGSLSNADGDVEDDA